MTIEIFDETHENIIQTTNRGLIRMQKEKISRIKCKCEMEEFEIKSIETKCESWIIIIVCLYCSQKSEIRLHKTVLDENWVLS